MEWWINNGISFLHSSLCRAFESVRLHMSCQLMWERSASSKVARIALIDKNEWGMTLQRHVGSFRDFVQPNYLSIIAFQFISWCQKQPCLHLLVVRHRVASGSEWVSGRPSVPVHRQTVKSWRKILRGSLRGIRSDLQIRLWTSNAWLVRLGEGGQCKWNPPYQIGFDRKWCNSSGEWHELTNKRNSQTRSAGRVWWVKTYGRRLSHCFHTSHDFQSAISDQIPHHWSTSEWKLHFFSGRAFNSSKSVSVSLFPSLYRSVKSLTDLSLGIWLVWDWCQLKTGHDQSCWTNLFVTELNCICLL